MPASRENESIPPPPFRLTSSGALEIRQGGGWISLLGAPFFLAGVFLAFLAVAPRQGLPRPVVGLMSLAFLGVGGVFVFGRRSLTLDVGMGFLIRRYSLLIPVRTEERRLDEFNAVVIAFQLGDSESPDHYPVRLQAIRGKDFQIRSPTEFGESRTQAEFLARFLRMPLTDITTDHEVVVSPERAHDTLQERLRSSGTQAESMERPPATRCEVSESDGKTRIVIPFRKSPVAAGFAVLVSSLMILVIAPAAWRMFSRTDVPVVSRFAFIAFLIFAFGILPLVGSGAAFGAIRNRTVVTASPAGLVIERGAWRTRTTSISAADILDVDYSTMDGILESARRSAGNPVMSSNVGGRARLFAVLKELVPSKGIVVKSRKGLTTFGEGLPADELRFLKSVLTRALA